MSIKSSFFALIQLVLLNLILCKYLGTSSLSYSIWSIILLTILLFINNNYCMICKKISMRQKMFCFIGAMLFGTLQGAGIFLTTNGSLLGVGFIEYVIQISSSIALGLLTYTLIINIDYFLRKYKYKINGNNSINIKKIYFYNLLLILLCWLPILLAYYPGIFAYDASNQVMQVINHDYTTHHPLVHTLLLGGFFSIGNAIGDNNLGVLLYSFFQMFVIAAIMSEAIVYMLKKGMSKTMYGIVLLFYAFFPINSMMAISTTKDVLFSAFMLGLLITLWELFDDESLWKSKKVIFVGFVFLIGIMLLRNNAIYACVLSCAIICILLKRNRKRFCLFIFSGLVISSLLNWGISSALDAQKGSMVEMLSVPLQQIARVGKYHEDELDSEIKKELYSFINKEVVQNYAPNISDGVKNFVDEKSIKNDPMQFLRLYIKLAVRYPREYIDAFASLTQGFWYLEDTSNANIYGSGMESRLGYMLTNYKNMPEGYEVKHKSYFPQLEYILEKLFSDNKYLEIPLISVFFAPAFYCWLLITFILIFLYRKKYDILVPGLILFCYLLTLLLGPTCIIRYVYPIVIAAPLLCFQILRSHN